MAKLKKEIIWEIFEWRNLIPSPVIGVDEVGRGCLVGAVYAAAVILDGSKDCSEFTDSKLISAERREELSQIIITEHQACVGFATVEEIEKLNIFHASLLAMWRAVMGLKVGTGHVVVDGKFPVPDLTGFTQTPLIKGDLRCNPVGAASIVAKVARDNEMKILGEKYPQYGFELHKGYATPTHKKAIKKFGVLPEHRKSFAGVKEHIY